MRIHLSEYDPLWPAMFAAERDRLLEALRGDCLSIEHIGSTAIPGLAAKPVIDMMIGVDTLENAAARFVAPIVALAYEYMPQFEDTLPNRRFFRKPHGGIERTHHIHLFRIDDPDYRRHIAFRDFLRTQPIRRQEYEELKMQLAAQEWDDMNAYAGAKTAFIRRVEAEAMGVGAGE